MTVPRAIPRPDARPTAHMQSAAAAVPAFFRIALFRFSRGDLFRRAKPRQSLGARVRGLGRQTFSRRRLFVAALGALAGLSFFPAPSPAQTWPSCQRPSLLQTPPAELGLDASVVGDLQALLDDAVARRRTESAALVVLHRGGVLFRGAAGNAGPDSIFDLASLTKVVATAPAVMRLTETGKLALDQPASRYDSLLGSPDKRAITLHQLLVHTSGLHSVVWRGRPEDGPSVIRQRIRQSRMKAAPGQTYRYSDLGFIALGDLVQAVSGEPLDAFAQKHIFEPLGMCDTGFNPPPTVTPRVVSPWPGGEKAGTVYDPLAVRLGGVAGHAGLYSTVDDLARFGLMMLNEGKVGGTRVLSTGSVRQLRTPHALPGHPQQTRGLAWDINSPHAGCKGRLSGQAYGHTGYTGTSLWLDPQRELVIALLTNRTFYKPAPSVSGLRRRIHTLLATSLSSTPPQPVLTGLDRLVATNFAPLHGKKVAVITNKTATDANGRWLVDLLLRQKEVTLQALFVPEHGLGAKVDRHVNDSALRRGKRKIPVYSLFGSRRRPTSETLAGCEALVLDLREVGVRYYTYLSTMGWAMEAAAQAGIPFFVLDRPNPLGGLAVQGPVSSEARRVPTNYHPLPVRYGMTLGELARLFNAQRGIEADLHVIPLQGWKRAMLFHHTGLPWANPSPNIRTWRQALLYAGVGLLESTPLAVGRGTKTPFQLVGAPWIDGRRWAAELRREKLTGVQFIPTTFTPRAKPHRGQSCHGVRLVITDAQRFHPVKTGIVLAVTLRRLYREKWDVRNLYRLINNPATTGRITAGQNVEQIMAGFGQALRQFRQTRRKYLLY